MIRLTDLTTHLTASVPRSSSFAQSAARCSGAGLAVLLGFSAVFGQAASGADTAPASDAQVVFEEDFESGSDHWEMLDPDTWRLKERSDGHGIEITERGSAYKPPFRSPGHVALVKDLSVGNCEIRFRVRSTKDTGNHRDCCVFFGFQDAANFYYVHLGAKPDPHSGQIMIVNDAPRLAMTTNERLTPWDDDWHDVMVRRAVSTGLIEVYFDDMETPHMSVSDTTFGAGRLGIGSFDDLNEFDDFSVSTF